jgi:hypothetical protein
MGILKYLMQNDYIGSEGYSNIIMDFDEMEKY